ncbi:peptidase [Aureococcus anophagefferens]|nr:peptidase [Aureococcus anophagefferens]
MLRWLAVVAAAQALQRPQLPEVRLPRTKQEFSSALDDWRGSLKLPDAGSFVGGAVAGVALSVFVALSPVGDAASGEPRETPGRDAVRVRARGERLVESAEGAAGGVGLVISPPAAAAAQAQGIAVVDAYEDYAWEAGLRPRTRCSPSSASASEIVSGAIQDYDAGVILGTRTFGKGLIQDVSALPFDGAALKVTVGRYYTPSGRCLQALSTAASGMGAPRPVTAPPQTSTASSREAFRTLRSKRLIESGGGVSPDVVVEAEVLTKGDGACPASSDLRRGLPRAAARPRRALYDRGAAADGDAAGAVLARGDLAALEARAVAAAKAGELRYAPKAGEDQAKDDAAARAAVARDVSAEFRRNPDRILKVADAVLQERFFRSTALLKAQLPHYVVLSGRDEASTTSGALSPRGAAGHGIKNTRASAAVRSAPALCVS